MMTEANDAYRYDAFISYSHRDKDWVDGWLLPRLEATGLRVCIDFRDFEPGLPSLVNMENAVERSRKTLIVLTPAWVESQWTTFESLLIQTDDPPGRQRRMIPLRLNPCEPPKRIAMLTYVDFTQPAEAEFQLQRLVAAIRAEPMPDVPRPVPEEEAEEAKPEIPPPPAPIQPPEMADFVGRETELAYFADKLATSHLAVITGMAGVGKTALAAVLTQQVGDSDKTFWHSFHEGEGIDVIIWKLAGFLAWHGQEDLWRMLQIARQSGGQTPPPEVLFDYVFQLVPGQGYLLCFDDFQFVDDDPLLAQLVERLRSAVLAGELLLVVTSRRMPEFVQMVEFETLTGLSAADTHRLLAKRGLSLPDDLAANLYTHTEGNAEFLTLAIDALQRARDPVRLIARLAETDDIERFLMNEVDDGLTEDERDVMSAVAVLLGYPGTRAAIEAVLDKGGVQRALIDLSSRYLLIVSESEAGREYGQHAIVQAFYYDLLGRRERQTMHRRAGEYYETEEPDILKAARHFERAGEFERAARLATAEVWALINQGQARAVRQLLGRFKAQQLDTAQWVDVNIACGEVCALLGDFNEAIEAYGTAFAQLMGGAMRSEERRRAADLAQRIGRLQGWQAQYDEALGWMEKGLQALGEQLDDASHATAAMLHVHTGTIYYYRGHYDDAVARIQRGLAIVEGTDHVAPMAEGYNLLGAVYDARGGRKQAIGYYEKSLSLWEELGNTYQMARVQDNVGIVYFHLGRWEEAAEVHRQALAFFERIEDRDQMVYVCLNLGNVHLCMGEWDVAEDLFEQARTLSEKVGNLRMLALSYTNLGLVSLEQEDWAKARDCLERSLGLLEQHGIEDFLPETYAALGRLCLREGDAVAALSWGQRALEGAQSLEMQLEVGQAHRVLGMSYWVQGNLGPAEEHLRQSLAVLESLKHHYEVGRTLVQLARVCRHTGWLDEARDHLKRAIAIFDRLGAQAALREARFMADESGIE